MKSAAIILNAKKTDAVPVARQVASWLMDRGVFVMAEHTASVAMHMPSLSRDDKELATADFALVLGGDGTLLHASQIMAPAGVPMLAIRFGNFGFLTDVLPDETPLVVERVINGDYKIDARMMLSAHVHRQDEQIASAVALNDMVIAKGPLARMLRFATHVSGKYVSTYAADGLIVATPTGSTAYSLSAGGPLVSPDLKVTIITPICPHTLNARSLIISNQESVEIIVEGDLEDTVMLTVDGQSGIPLQTGDKVTIKEAECKAKLISTGKITYFDKLQTRLRWGDRFDS